MAPADLAGLQRAQFRQISHEKIFASNCGKRCVITAKPWKDGCMNGAEFDWIEEARMRSSSHRIGSKVANGIGLPVREAEVDRVTSVAPISYWQIPG